MPIDTQIKDGKGTGKKATVSNNGELYVCDIGLPPKDAVSVLRPFASLLNNSAGATDMLVTGSLAAPIDFYIQAGNLGGRYVQTLAFTIADGAASLNQFGNIAALTNGCQLIYQDSDLGDVVIAESLQTNFDFVQLCNFEPTFGTGSAAFLASNVVGSSEAYVPILDMTDVFGLPYGLHLPKDSTNKIILRIRDAVGAIDRFDVKAFGFDRIDHD
jgi:hypothetical protein